MAEIEYFVDPDKKVINKFAAVAATKCKLLSRERQMSGEPAVDCTLQEALDEVFDIIFTQKVFQIISKFLFGKCYTLILFAQPF